LHAYELAMDYTFTDIGADSFPFKVHSHTRLEGMEWAALVTQYVNAFIEIQ